MFGDLFAPSLGNWGRFNAPDKIEHGLDVFGAILVVDWTNAPKRHCGFLQPS